MSWSRRTVAPVVLAALLVAAPACGSTDAATDRSGFALRADQLAAVASTTTTIAPEGEPDPTRWDVEVATATVPVVTALCRPPTEPIDATSSTTAAGAPVSTNGCTLPMPDPAKPALSEIPSTTPNVGSAQIEGGWTFNNPTYFGNPLVFLVTQNRGEWLEVLIPARPNGQTGWVRADEVEVTSHRWHAEIDVSDSRLRVWNGDELVADTPTVDGKATTPTPLGRHYYNEKIERSPSSAYGSWILSTNAYSDTLETFDGGLPVYATHGTPDETQLGSDISNGCTRVPNAVVELLAAEMPLGTPLDIIA